MAGRFLGLVGLVVRSIGFAESISIWSEWELGEVVGKGENTFTVRVSSATFGFVGKLTSVWRKLLNNSKRMCKENIWLCKVCVCVVV